jgi:hypothetical protein
MEGRLRGKILSSTKEKGRREMGGKGVPRIESGGCEKEAAKRIPLKYHRGAKPLLTYRVSTRINSQAR